MPRLIALLSAASLMAGVAAGPAAALDTPARAAIVVDMTSGAVLMEKDADEPLPPASMSKLMTMNMVFEALAEGRLSLDDRMPVSEKAWAKGGSKMFVNVGDRIRVGDLIQGVTVQSGNDACIVLAEGLAGTEEAFAERMNARAKEIGLTHSHFVNATGWPDEGHVMSVRDLATLAERIVEEFPEQHRYFSVREFTWEGITQQNRNPLLYLDIGATGMKTGHTEDAGYGLVATVEREGRKVVVVIAGLESAGARRVEAEKLVAWAYREFRTGALYRAGEMVAQADVWIGAADAVGLAPARDIVVTAPAADAEGLTARVRYEGPVAAPITKGDVIAELVVETPGVGAVSHPLVATEDVPAGGVLARVTAAARLALSAALGAAGLDEVSVGDIGLGAVGL
ncbi:D-alanyl-D-alanine carboxypeptidase family protein [Rubrimonas cliftonensis]|uniref:serine-type D-Ala-D-Ala carboxypeptidase n=1 Tax=Rubrimonas cliftonensis TaxID=89524 RepID=A0A1H3VFI4_9RHOB|nr:D-alanyl-D-alanine carboxypeptidase family protein [Rubrimonas cliftonensis]SDZ73553.1 D-alanyl-D-alanine carboxypeptidase (penicillin-binding protein 5/6) [Rubrimonas cliftonensis]